MRNRIHDFVEWYGGVLSYMMWRVGSGEWHWLFDYGVLAVVLSEAGRHYSVGNAIDASRVALACAVL